jgi:very-short-patch-repair endonuclease
MNRPFEKQCPECGNIFIGHLGDSSSDYCSTICSGYDYINARVEALSKALRRREAWRYVDVNSYLNQLKIPHEFEYVLGNFVFDLALIDDGILIEFDESYHQGTVQQTKDLAKDALAEDNKWVVFRVSAVSNAVIPVSSIDWIIEMFALGQEETG